MTLRLPPAPCRVTAALVAAAMVVACGGGGDGTPSAGPTPGSADGSASAPTRSAVAVAVTGTCGLPDFAFRAMVRINQLRTAGADCGSAGRFNATAALTWNDRLAVAADGHSTDMVADNFFSHTSADGRSLSDRATAAGYLWSSLGENIAAGQRGVDAVMDAWIASPGHCANLMNAGFTEVGLVCVPGTPADTYATYWTMDLGRSR